MQQKYGVPVLAVNCLDLSESDIRQVLSNVLMEFPVKEIKVNIPRWILSLEQGHWLKSALLRTPSAAAADNCTASAMLPHSWSRLKNVSRSSAHRLPVWI